MIGDSNTGLYSSPNNKILAFFQLKAFAGNEWNVTQNINFGFHRVEHTVVIGENAEMIKPEHIPGKTGKTCSHYDNGCHECNYSFTELTVCLSLRYKDTILWKNASEASIAIMLNPLLHNHNFSQAKKRVPLKTLFRKREIAG